MFGRGPTGILSFMKEGTRTFSGQTESTLRNIEACQKLSSMCQAVFGPAGLCKMVINHLNKETISTCSRRILEQAEVNHPAAKLIDEAAKLVSSDYGDSSNTLVILAGQLLHQASELLKNGVHIRDIISGYELATTMIDEYLAELTIDQITNLRDKNQLSKVIRSVLGGNSFTNNEYLVGIMAENIAEILPENPAEFDPDNIRVLPIPGTAIEDSKVVKGIAIATTPHGEVQECGQCGVMVMSSALEQPGTETKGIIIIKSSEELMAYASSEEALMDKTIGNIAKTGVGAIICSGSINSCAQHFCNKHNIMTLKVLSKFDIRRLSRALNATTKPLLELPSKDEIGEALSIKTVEMASQRITILESRQNQIITILLRGVIYPLLQDIEFTIGRAGTSIKTAAKDGRLLPGGGATEIALAVYLRKKAMGMNSVEKYAILAFASALEHIPTTLATIAGFKSAEIVGKLFEAQENGDRSCGLAIRNTNVTCESVKDSKIYDIYCTKQFMFKILHETVSTILKIDEIIMAKPSGGFKPRGPNMDDD